MIPTSNHNYCLRRVEGTRVVYLLIPTSNHNSRWLFQVACALYIFWFLHQTTTRCRLWCFQLSCISFDSYIKPQPVPQLDYAHVVVYLLIPTSNHNLLMHLTCFLALYIFWFLHQTTTGTPNSFNYSGCISFDSYIKPQRVLITCVLTPVVYLLIPTSNHNFWAMPERKPSVVYLLIPTSNHNVESMRIWSIRVVYLLIPTSNHNRSAVRSTHWWVVYLLIPTSNHNLILLRIFL